MKKKFFTERKIITFYSKMEKHKIFEKIGIFHQTLSLPFRLVHFNRRCKQYLLRLIALMYKGYLFQNKIYFLDKIYLCFAKIKLSKHTLYRSSRTEMFHEKGVLRNFANFTGKNTCTRVSFLIKLEP